MLNTDVRPPTERTFVGDLRFNFHFALSRTASVCLSTVGTSAHQRRVSVPFQFYLSLEMSRTKQCSHTSGTQADKQDVRFHSQFRCYLRCSSKLCVTGHKRISDQPVRSCVSKPVCFVDSKIIIARKHFLFFKLNHTKETRVLTFADSWLF